MANYATLKAAIQAAIYENGNQEITGSVMQATLLAMINSLGAGYQYMGIATPETNPETPDARVYYIAFTAGTYVNFGGIIVNENEVVFLRYDSEWHKDSAGFATKQEVDSLITAVGDMSAFAYAEYQPVAVSPVLGHYYNFQRLEAVESSLYEYAVLNVQPGEKYSIDGWNLNSNIPLAFVLNSATNAKARAISQSSAMHLSGEYTIPNGYDRLYVNGRTANYPVQVSKWVEGQTTVAELLTEMVTEKQLMQQNPLRVKMVERNFYVAGSSTVKGKVLYISQHFDNDKDVVWQLGNKSGSINKFFDFQSISKIARLEKGLNINTSSSVLEYVLGHDTDYILPIRVKAVNNINGDFTGDENYFTGGAHGYGNATSGSVSQTMSQQSFVARLDGRTLNVDDDLYGQRLEIECINNVQASNTEKSDGSGREVIQQRIRIVMTGDNRMDVEVEWKALEDVKINTLHCFGAYLDLSAYRFVGSSSKMNDYATNTWQTPTDERTNAIRMHDAAQAFEVGMSKTYGLGDGRYRDGARNAFSTNAKKGYFNVLKDDGTEITLAQGDMVCYKGYYTFRPIGD